MKARTLAMALAMAVMLYAPAFAASYTGWITDAKCNIGLGKAPNDAGHSGCAESCIKTGGPVGLQTADGKLYLLAPSGDPKNLTSFRTKLAAMAGKKVTVNGTIKSKGGTSILFVDGDPTPAK